MIMSDPNLPTLDSAAEALSTPKRQALTALIRGSNIKDAAQTAGVHRTTLHRWISSHPDFAAAYNAWQQECKESTKTQLLSVAQEALVAVVNAIKAGDHRIAYKLLKDLGLLTKLAPGLTDPQLLGHQMELNLKELKRSLDPAIPNPAPDAETSRSA
jgi:hypothetical protein